MTIHRLITKNISIDQVERPDILYKYRDWSSPYHDTIIKNRQVYLAPPSSFEDKLDCKNPTRYDLLTDEQIYEKYLHFSKIHNKHFSRQQHRKYARDNSKTSPFKQKGTVEKWNAETFAEYDTRFGVLCLTSNPKNKAMWTKYANDHTGICVGLDPDIVFKYIGGGGIVTYVDELPIILPEPFQSMNEQHILQVHFKEMKWNFEEEYRTHKFSYEPFSDQDRTLTLPPTAFKELIFGVHVNNNDREEIIKNIHEDLSHIKLRQAKELADGIEIIDL